MHFFNVLISVMSKLVKMILIWPCYFNLWVVTSYMKISKSFADFTEFFRRTNERQAAGYLVVSTRKSKINGVEFIFFVSLFWKHEVLCMKSVRRNFAKLRGKHQCQILFFDKVAGLRPATLLKKRLCQRCFPVNFDKFLR